MVLSLCGAQNEMMVLALRVKKKKNPKNSTMPWDARVILFQLSNQ